MCKRNLELVVEQATEADKAEGMLAWRRYYRLLKSIGDRTGHSASVATGVFAALSPNNDYLGNLRDTVRLLRAHQRGLSAEQVKVSTYHANKHKAWDIACGAHPLAKLRAPKTRSFFLNISNPDDAYPVTVDGHIFNAWAGVRVPLVATPSRGRKAHYDVVAEDVRTLARAHGLLGNQMQAIIWFCWRRTHRIKTDNQLELLPADELIADFY